MNLEIRLDEKSINHAIAKLKDYKKGLERKRRLLIEKLALVGANEASVRFTTAIYDGANDVAVNLRRIKDGWAIVAKGQAVCFIEFGSGVYHNPVEPYPLPRPEGVVGIGEYGKGRGSRPIWVYYDETGKKVFARGNPAALGMWYATEEMRRSILDVAREVFK